MPKPALNQNPDREITLQAARAELIKAGELLMSLDATADALGGCGEFPDVIHKRVLELAMGDYTRCLAAYNNSYEARHEVELAVRKNMLR